MNILIADDERLIRLALKSMIEELEPNTHTFIEAKNGKELIKSFKDNSIDLAFVDIQMPLMDGLSAIEQCIDSFSTTQWFILTGEKEFSLVKKAISLGVKDYLLKPISLDDLNPILSNTKVSKKDFIIKENNNFELSIISTFNKLIVYNPKKNDIEVNKDSFKYKFYLFSIDGLYNVDNKSLASKKILSSIREFILDNLDDNLRFATYYINFENLILVVRDIKEINLNFSTLLSSIQSNTYSITIFTSSIYSSISNCYIELRELIELTSIRSIENFRGLINLKEYSDESKKEYLRFSRYILSLTQSYINKEELLYKEYVSKIKDSMSMRTIYGTINKDSLSEFLELSIGFNFDFNNSFSMFTNSLLNHASTIFSKNPKIVNDSLIDEIIKYVKSNYMHEIGVNTIALLYNITPNYLSKIFHEKSGLKFIDYITSIRINESKKLLASSNLSVKEISKKVGYNSPRHFSKQFLKLEGITPSEFVKSQKS